jgi:hypothetical protein
VRDIACGVKKTTGFQDDKARIHASVSVIPEERGGYSLQQQKIGKRAFQNNTTRMTGFSRQFDWDDASEL